MSYICDCVKIYCRYVFAVYTHIAFEGGTYCVWSQCKCAPNVVNYPTVRKEMTCWIASMIFAIPCNPKIWLHWTKRPRSETPGFVFFREVVAWKMNYTLFHSQLFEWNILHMFVGQRRSCDLTPFWARFTVLKCTLPCLLFQCKKLLPSGKGFNIQGIFHTVSLCFLFAPIHLVEGSDMICVIQVVS